MENGLATRFVKGVLSTGSATLVVILFGFLNVVVAVRHVPKESFGTYILLQVAVLLFTMAGDLGLNLSTARFVACREEGDKDRVINTMLVYKLLAVATIALLLVPLRGVLGRLFGNGPFLDLCAYLPLLVAAESFSGLFSAVLQGLHQYRKMAMAQTLLSSVNFAAILLLVVKGSSGVVGLIHARLIALTVSLLFQFASVHRRLRFGFQPQLFKEIFTFGFPLGLNSVLTFIFTRIDSILLGAMLSPVQVAYFGTASKIPDASRQMFESFRTVFFPNMSAFFASGIREDAESLLNNSLRLITFVALGVTLAVCLFSQQIIGLLFSQAYLQSAPVLAVLMLAVSIGLVGNILGTSLVSAGYSRLPVLINIVDAGVNVAANLLLIPLFGALGAACAALVSRLATNPVNVWFLKKNGIRVSTTAFVKPAVIFCSCLLLSTLVAADAFAGKVALLSGYLLASGVCSVVRFSDCRSLLHCVRCRPQPAEVRS